jgi:hypothetical protein
MLYHVTQKEKVGSIKRKGLLPLQTSNWVKGTGERYGNGEVFACEDRQDAVRWAARMDWEYNQAVGSGEIAVITISDSEGWEADESDPISQAGNNGRWLKRMRRVLPEHIGESFVVTPKEIQKIVRK